MNPFSAGVIIILIFICYFGSLIPYARDPNFRIDIQLL